MPENSIYMYSLSVDQIYKKLNFYAIGTGINGWFYDTAKYARFAASWYRA